MYTDYIHQIHVVGGKRYSLKFSSLSYLLQELIIICIMPNLSHTNTNLSQGFSAYKKQLIATINKMQLIIFLHFLHNNIYDNTIS